MTNIERAKHFNSISYFLYAWIVYIARSFFYYTEVILMRH